MAQRPLIAGNWKMNGRRADAGWADAFASAGPAPEAAEVALCPPFPLLALMGDSLAAAGVALGAQDCSAEAEGAFTGEVSADLLADLGCRYVIVGHSERRRRHSESDGLVRRKAEAALAAGLVPIICVGETAEARDAGHAEAVVAEQVARSRPSGGGFAVAYEPVWAIGAGRAAGPRDASAMHAHIRHALGAEAAGVRVLYGGSVTPDIAPDMLAAQGVDGLLVGGASLDPDALWRIAQAAG